MKVNIVCVTLVAVVLGVPASAQSTRRPLIPGLPPVFSGLSLANLPGISQLMNMPLPFNVPLSLSSFPPLRLPIRLPAILGGSGGMLRNATHLIRNTFLTPLTSSSSSSSSGSSGSSSAASNVVSSLSSLNTNSLTQMLAAPFLPLLNFGSSGSLQAADRRSLVTPTQYAQILRALQLQTAHERQKRSIVHHMLRNYQPNVPAAEMQIPLEAQFRPLYRFP